MLQIQRASAGSGKTYTLTQKFILHLLAEKEESGEWRLRSYAEIDDTLSKILAITFTNKATNEMKQRIVDKLSSLAEAQHPESLTPKFIKDTDYLKFLAEKTGEDFEEIGRKAAHALKTILNNYSIFHIATIDSFFQEILRTFAYESNINDGYQLEIDSEFIVTSALDSTLNEFEDRANANTNARHWLRIIMEDEVKKSQMWNVFNKSESSRSIYSQIKNAIYKLESEEFKSIKEKLDQFFSEEDSAEKLQEFYKWLKASANKEREDKIEKVKSYRNQILKKIEQEGVSPEALQANFTKQLDKIASLQVNSKISFNYYNIWKEKKIYKKSFKGSKPDSVVDLADKMYSELSEFENPSADTLYMAWKVYGRLLPYFGLILEVSKELSSLMDSDNIIRISDTSYLLKRIIGEEDTPFIYDRIGAHIENYLIDEFQDTSRMQWDVIKPLLSTSLAEAKESLIIGDPKQSIYRFRNADHNLITTEVPNSFPHVSSGMSKEENTNWRSLRNIVEFNNFFFRSLSSILIEKEKDLNKQSGIGDLYSNVVQYPNAKERSGYVEIQFFDKENLDEVLDSDSDGVADEANDWFSRMALSKIGPLISSLIDRGYRQKDIAVLVNTNDRGKKVIETLIAYNSQLPEDAKKIDFISEESLLISQSPSVDLIINVLEKLTDCGFIGNISDDDNKEKYKKISWNKVRSNYFYYSLVHPEMSVSEKVMRFLENEDSDKFLRKMISNLQTPSLTAIVETITKSFLDQDQINSDGIYLAAFQDVIKEFCENNSDDPASFLEWWRSKGRKISVSSPEDMEAVQIMTIHKSKGLEFKCVIIPFAQDNMEPSRFKEEWRWVSPAVNDCQLDLPPFLPVLTNNDLAVKHPEVYNSYYDQVMIDKLNMYYVAMTRAVDELYIYSKNPDSGSTGINRYLKDICGNPEEHLSKISSEESGLMPRLEDFENDEETGVIAIGEKLTPEEIAEEYSKKKSGPEIIKRTVNNYYISEKLPQLHFIVEDNADFG
ncbi:MAG: UvrD-helicase domain-containing protein [Muribaculaceae bacterium]|nr:UvrD-helicase domain-containing protein [Muribaculaceae bacterium]